MAIIATTIPALRPLFSQERRNKRSYPETREAFKRYSSKVPDDSNGSKPTSDWAKTDPENNGSSVSVSQDRKVFAPNSSSNEDMTPLVPLNGIGKRVEVSVV